MSTYTVSDFRDGRGVKRIVPPSGLGGGHGGGDRGLINAWLMAVAQKKNGQAQNTTGATNADTTDAGPLGVGSSVRDQLRVFLHGFAIEEARRESKVIDCAEFERRMFERYSRYSASRLPATTGPAIDVEYEPEMPST
jgi:hypothetical protein